MKKKNTAKKIDLKKMTIVENLKVESRNKIKGGATDGCSPASALCTRVPLC